MRKAKILICNTALRSSPDNFPPVACTSICNALIKKGYDPVFYDLDVLRPSHEEIRRYLLNAKFDIVGISAVVSTAYRYVKELSSIIREVSPNTRIILGGNLAAAWEVLLNKCAINICVMGEGEKVIAELLDHWEAYGDFSPNESLNKIKGLAYLDKSKKIVLTGQAEQLTADQIDEPDYGMLERFGVSTHYIADPMSRPDFKCDPRSYEPHRAGKRMATIFTSKGCINKCTFCHRWIRGYRILPLQKVMESINYLIEKHNVGFFCICDECFGEDREWLEDFVRMIKPLDILFQIGGARVSLVKKDPSIIRRLRDAGLTAIYFGMESGSDKILKAMAKNATSRENLEAAKLCAEAGVSTVIQIVLGLPGENDQTVDETIEFVNKATENLKQVPEVSINYLQALPGTHCYEFLRSRGFLRGTLEDEENYLLKISDINATEFRHYINVSDEPLSKVKLWKRKIVLKNRINWLKKQGWRFPAGTLCQDKKFRSGLKYNPLVYRFIDQMGDSFWKVSLFSNRLSLYGPLKTLLFTSGVTRERKGLIHAH